MKLFARYIQLNRSEKKLIIAGIVYDVLLVMITCIGAWAISNDPATRIGMVLNGFVLSGLSVVSFHGSKLWTEDYSFWIYCFVASVIGTGIVIQTNLVYWHLIEAIVTGQSSEVTKLWAQQTGGLFVFIGIACVYSSIFGFLRSAYMRLIRRLFIKKQHVQ